MTDKPFAIALCVLLGWVGVLFQRFIPGFVVFYGGALIACAVWVAGEVFVKNKPPCSLAMWWRMHKLGYEWSRRTHFQCASADTPERFVTHEEEGWVWAAWAEFGTPEFEETGGPFLDPVAAHAAGCLQNWRS